jgi:hypothetical protein
VRDILADFQKCEGTGQLIVFLYSPRITNKFSKHSRICPTRTIGLNFGEFRVPISWGISVEIGCESEKLNSNGKHDLFISDANL